MIQALGDVLVLITEDGAPPFDRLCDEGNRNIVQSEARIHGSHGIHERCLDFRLLGEFFVDTLDTLVENFARRDGIAERLAGV